MDFIKSFQNRKSLLKNYFIEIDLKSQKEIYLFFGLFQFSQKIQFTVVFRMISYEFTVSRFQAFSYL